MIKKESKSVIKNLFWAMISLLIAVLTISTIIRQTKVFSINTMIDMLSGGKPAYILLAGLFMLLFIFAEGEALRLILVKIYKSVSGGQAFLYSAADIYFSAITPSASGGQPASLFFMMRDGIPGTVCTICLIYNLMMYNASIIVIALSCIIFRFNIFMEYIIQCKLLIILGIILLCGLMIGFYLLLKKSEWLLNVGFILIALLTKIHIIRNQEKWKEKIIHKVDSYKDISTILFEDRDLAIRVFLMNLLQRSVQISIAPLVYMGLGGKIDHMLDAWFTQAYSVIGSNCIPIPGAMGVVDYLLLNGFGHFMSEKMAVHTEMLARGVSFYICIAISFITVIAGYFKTNRGNMKI